jgi:hypothetical protein
MRYREFSNVRPQLFPVKKVVGFDQEMMEAIDKWRAKQTPLPNVSEAIRRLVELGLAIGKSQPQKTAPAPDFPLPAKAVENLLTRRHERRSGPGAKAK